MDRAIGSSIMASLPGEQPPSTDAQAEQASSGEQARLDVQLRRLPGLICVEGDA